MMNPADLGVVQAYLKDLRLPAIARMLPDTLRDAEQHGRSPLDVLRVLLKPNWSSGKRTRVNVVFRLRSFHMRKASRPLTSQPIRI